MIRTLVEECRRAPRPPDPDDEALARLAPDAPLCVSRLLSWLEARGPVGGADVERVRAELGRRKNLIERHEWISHARRLHEGKYGELVR